MEVYNEALLHLCYFAGKTRDLATGQTRQAIA